MDDHSKKLENTRPLGKSVEDVQDDQSNRVNPDTPREDVDDGIPPIPVLGATEGTPMAARGNYTPLLGKQEGGETTDEDNRDETTDSSQS